MIGIEQSAPTLQMIDRPRHFREPAFRGPRPNPMTQELRLRVASPCSEKWDGMTGDERARSCGLCKKNVYDLSKMTTREVLELVREREGGATPPCVRFFMRADGTVMTADCPEGRRRVLRRRWGIAALMAGAMALVAGGWSAFGGWLRGIDDPPTPTMGTPKGIVMGEVCVPPPAPPPK